MTSISWQLEEDTSSKERDESLETDSTAGHSVNSVSTVSAVSSHPVLTRQGMECWLYEGLKISLA